MKGTKIRICPDCGVRELDYRKKFCPECAEVRRYLRVAIHQSGEVYKNYQSAYRNTEKFREYMREYMRRRKREKEC